MNPAISTKTKSKKRLSAKKRNHIVTTHKDGSQTTVHSGNNTSMMTPFFERPSSVVEKKQKFIDVNSSMPENALNI